MTTDDAERATTGSETAPRAKFRWGWAVVICVGGACGIYLAAPEREMLDAAWTRLGGVTVPALAIVIGGAIGLVVTEAIRIAAIARIVGARVGVRDAWDAAVANHVMTAITPQVGLGEPTVAYTLAKRGVAWDAAVAVPFIKFSTSLALVMAIGGVLVIAGHAPPGDATIDAILAAWFLVIAALSMVAIAVCARPALAHRWIARISAGLARRRWFASTARQARIARAAEVAARTVDRLASVQRSGASNVFVLGVVHLLYYASYIAPLVGLALVLGDPPLVALVLRSLVYLCFVFAMPTPGGAGPSEAVAVVFFGDLVGAADAIVVVIVFRAATFYLQLAIGALYLPILSLARSPR